MKKIFFIACFVLTGFFCFAQEKNLYLGYTLMPGIGVPPMEFTDSKISFAFSPGFLFEKEFNKTLSLQSGLVLFDRSYRVASSCVFCSNKYSAWGNSFYLQLPAILKIRFSKFYLGGGLGFNIPFFYYNQWTQPEKEIYFGFSNEQLEGFKYSVIFKTGFQFPTKKNNKLFIELLIDRNVFDFDYSTTDIGFGFGYLFNSSKSKTISQ